MIDLAFDSALEKLLNQFPVPMFAVDRREAAGEFSFVSVNQAMTKMGRRSRDEMLGKSLHQLLPKGEADLAHERYAACVDSGRELRFQDRFMSADRSLMWDTTLQHVALQERGDRVVGVSIQMDARPDPDQTTPMLDDIQYFSSMADLQLQNLISTFEIYRDRELFAQQNEQHIDNLAAMCRTVQRAVADIKKVVKSSNDPGVPQVAPPRGRIGSDPGSVGSDTIGLLFQEIRGDLKRSR